MNVSIYNYISMTIFEKIIAKEIPGVFLYEDDLCVVIMDAFPTTRGQCLVIPREAIDYAFDCSDELYLHLMSVSKKIARALDASLSPVRTCMVIEGFEVPHTHIKLYPICKGEKLNTSGGEQVEVEVLEKLAEEIRKGL